MGNSSQFAPQVEGIGLLDILVTLAENIKLLILGPLLAGVLAWGSAFLLPKTFESVAVLQALPEVAGLMTTAAVLDPVAQSLGLRQGTTTEKAREGLRARTKTSIGRNDKLVTLTVSGETPAKAQATASALLEATYAQSQPKGSHKVRLEKQLAEAQTRLRLAPSALTQLERSLLTTPTKPISSPSAQQSEALDLLAIGSVGLLDVAASAQKEIVELESELEGLTGAQLVQAPTLPDIPTSPNKGKIAGMAALGSGFLLLTFVFFLSGLRGIQDAERLAKLSRIRGSLGLSSK